MAIGVGTGTAIAFGTSGFTASVTAINGQDQSRPSIKTSHLGTTTWDTKIPGNLTDPGGVDMEIEFDPTSQPPINGAAETITVTFPDSSTVSASGFVDSWSWGSPLEDLMTASINVQFSGTVTWT